MHQVAGTEARGEQRARQAVVVGPRALGLVERTGRGEHAPARRAPAHRGEAAEGPRRLLQFEQLGLARHRQRGERRAAGDRIRIDVGEQPPERGRGGARMGDLRRQARQQLAFARLGIAGLARVVEIHLGSPARYVVRSFVWRCGFSSASACGDGSA